MVVDLDTARVALPQRHPHFPLGDNDVEYTEPIRLGTLLLARTPT